MQKQYSLFALFLNTDWPNTWTKTQEITVIAQQPKLMFSV